MKYAIGTKVTIPGSVKLDNYATVLSYDEGIDCYTVRVWDGNRHVGDKVAWPNEISKLPDYKEVAQDIKFNKGPRYIRAYKLDGKYRDAFAFFDRKYGLWFDAYNWLKPSHVQTPKATAEYLDVLLASYTF